jgi:hypothetical protein
MSRHGSRAWRSGEVGSGGLVTAVAGLALSLGSVGCELQEITLAESQDLVVAEVFVQIGQGANRITAFLHRTEDGNRGGGAEVPGAGVQLLVGPGIAAMDLLETDVDQCLVPTEDPADRVPGTCYAASPLDELLVSDGDSIRVVIDLPDGGQLWGETVVPEGFDIVSPSNSVCTLGAGQTLEIQWTASAGTWAYVSETVISGLRDVLEPEGIVVEEDPLDLVGLSISASDTTIVFPTEFGVFERFDLDRDLALLLQQGLPEGISAAVVVGAVDRNFVNWVRGGDFNPSGQVRIQSLQGDGTGVLGSLVRRTIRMDTRPGVSAPPCSG